MITVNIKGGLGNQMFQYACARALAIRNNDELRLVRIEKSADITRSFSLTRFKIAGEIGASADIGLWQNLRALLEQKLLRRFYVEFVPSVLTKKGDAYLDGYFQSEKYFIDQAATIRQDFTLKDNLSADARAAADVIRADDKAVSLHVRRGDYVDHPDFGGIADREYYARAIMKMRREIAFARFYVFSDDIAWCRANLPLPEEGTMFISKPGIEDYEELPLMALCQHNIIANSSFSWWGAWLNPSPTKIVIAPARWTNRHESWYHDIIPATWTRL